jgi:hypothetical protein
MVAGEVKQLRSLLAQQAAPQLSSTIQILDGPIAAAGAAGAAAGHATSKLSKPGSSAAGSDAASMFPALAAAGVASAAAAGDAGRASEPDVDGCSDTDLPARAFSDMADALSCLGPTANDLVKDYAEAYASMKENMEIRLRHEQRRGDFLQVGGAAAAGGDSAGKVLAIGGSGDGMLSTCSSRLTCVRQCVCSCLQGKLQQTEAALKDTMSQLDAAQK